MMKKLAALTLALLMTLSLSPAAARRMTRRAAP